MTQHHLDRMGWCKPCHVTLDVVLWLWQQGWCTLQKRREEEHEHGHDVIQPVKKKQRLEESKQDASLETSTSSSHFPTVPLVSLIHDPSSIPITTSHVTQVLQSHEYTQEQRNVVHLTVREQGEVGSMRVG